MIGIRPRDVAPFWVSMPMLYFFHERGFIPEKPRGKHPDQETVAVNCKISGDVVFVSIPGRVKPLQIPVSYLGTRLRCPGTELWFDLPSPRRRR
jgi:hypothetical protein